MEYVFLWNPRHILNAYQALQEWSYPRAEIPEEEEEAVPVERVAEESFDFEKKLEDSLKDL